MTGPEPDTVTRLLSEMAAGEPGASDRLWTLLHEELCELAARKMAREGPGHTLQPTALVHEVYGRLFGDQDIHWESRRHFFATAARAMERILIDHARRKGRVRHGGGRNRVPLDDVDDFVNRDPAEELAVSQALQDLEQINLRAAQIVRLRYFAGMTHKAVAALLGVSTRTVDGDWYFARAWLRQQLMGDESGAEEESAP